MSLEKAPETTPTAGRSVLDDPLVLRAFAHPLRLALHELLVRERRCTAAQAARELGISQGLATHHLRQLAKYGFAEQVAGGDRRERPWRVLSLSQTWAGADETDEGSAAAGLLEQTLVEQRLAHLLAWRQARREPEHRTWRGVTALDTSLLYLTADEAERLNQQFDELCRPFVERRTDVGSRPEGSRAVEVTLLAVPLPPTASGA